MRSNSLLNGSLQVIILKLLSDNNRMYGYEITQKVKEATVGGIVLTEGSLYPALYKLEGDGLVTTTSEIVDGRVRKYYRLTDQGSEQVIIKLEEVRSFIAQLQNVLSLKQSI
jgi:PadR family transcriptional regulator, regulatory protein PadR